MAQASHKITEFPGAVEPPDPLSSIPPDPPPIQDRDAARELRSMIEELQNTAREARRQQRQAEEEREQMRSKLLDLQERMDSGSHGNSQLKALIRERDMLLEQQSQYGPVISDLKQRFKSAEADIREASSERDTAVRERKQAQRRLEEAEEKRSEACRQRDAAVRQRDLAKAELEKALEKAAIERKNFNDAQKAIAETQKALLDARHEFESSRKKGEEDLAVQLVSLRQARDGMAAQIVQLKQRVSDLEDQLAEAGYAREAAEKTARECQAQLTDIQGVLEAAAAGNDAQKVEQLEATLLDLQAQLTAANESLTTMGASLAAASESNTALTENEARLTAELEALRSSSSGDPVQLTEARTSLVAAQKQIEAIIRDRDTIKEQLSENAIALERQVKDQAAELAKLRQMLNDNEGKVSQRGELEALLERRRLEMIELSVRLENAQREIRNLSASLAEARLHAKLSGHPLPPPTHSEICNSHNPDRVHGYEEIVAMRRCFQAFSRDQKQVGLLAELETHALQISGQAMQAGHPILHRVSTAFASLLGDLMELPEQISQSTLRTLNQTIEFVALLLSDPEIEGSVKLAEARVFIVDDEPGSCTMAVDALGLVGLNSKHAHSSAAAIAELSSNKYDLIILDVHLPDLDGFELSSHIRTMAPHAETPIFFVTGDSSLENRVKSSLRGGNEFIAKPYSVQELALKSLKSVITGQLRSR